MHIYIGFDDTDTTDSPTGTGKLARWFDARLPEGCHCLGVIRQQLLVHPEIPYTSHNSSACILVEMQDPALLRSVIDEAAEHLARHSVAGSDPGLCVVAETDPGLSELVSFGRCCTHRVMSQKQALQAAGMGHLSGHGGSNDGIIGAAAAVGLTAEGWLGRYIEYGDLRGYPEAVSVAELNARHIAVVSVDRNATAPAPQDIVLTNGWLRPRRIAHGPVLLVGLKEQGVWQNIYTKNKKKAFPPVVHLS